MPRGIPKSRIRSKPGPKRTYRSLFKAIKFEMPPKGARVIEYGFIGKDKNLTQWVYKKGDKTYTIIVEGHVMGEYTAGDWKGRNAPRIEVI